MSELSVHAAAIALIAVGVSLCPALAQPAAPSLDRPNRSAVDGVDAARRFWHLAATRRVDIALIGDSNSRVGAAGTGHEDAMGRSYAARFGMYASHVEPGAGGGFPSHGAVAWSCQPFQGFGSAQALDDAAFPSPSPLPNTYLFLSDQTGVPFNYNCGMVLTPDCPIAITGALRFHLTCVAPGSEAVGALNLCAREAWPGNIAHNYAALPEFPVQSPALSTFDITLDVPPGDRAPSGLLFCPSNFADERGSRGPLALTWQRVEAPSIATGIAYSPLWEEGGRSARYTLLTLQTLNAHTPMIEWYRQATRLQNADPVLLIQILHGGNDCNDFNPSLGPVGGFDSSSRQGHEDNIRGIISILRAWWIEAGNDPANLFFQLGPYHPRPEQELQLGFEQAWRSIVATDPQVFSVAGNRMSTVEEFESRGYRLNPADPYHLSATAFHAWSAATLRTLDGAICPGDYDQNGAANITDIFAYLSGWFAAAPASDFDSDGACSVSDIFSFLSAWFAGC